MKQITEIKYKISDEDKNTIFEKTDEKIGVLANYIVIFLIILSISIAFFSSVWENYSHYFFFLFTIDLFISFVFAGEFFYRWIHSKKKKKFLFQLLNIFDFLSFAPFFLLLLISWPGIYGMFAFFRIFRILRILELFEEIPITLRIFKWVIRHRTELITGLFLIFLTLIIFTSLVYISENLWGNSEDFSSLPKTIWWGIYALTTSWDSGIIPVSIIGRILAGILMVMWPILISLLSSVLVLIFLDSTSMIDLNKKKVKCKHCKTNNSSDARYCKSCGKKL